MDDKRRSDTFKSPSNLLLSAARGGFTLDDISASPLLVPVAENSSSVLHSDVEEVDLSAGAPSVLPASFLPVVPATAQDLPPSAALGGGLASSFGSFTSALFGSLPSSEPQQLPPPLPGTLAGPDDSFQPVSLEPATGPTPVFYNPGNLASSAPSLVPHGPPPPPSAPAPTPPPPFVNEAGLPGALVYGRPFEPQPSDLYFTKARPPGAQPPAIPLLESPVGYVGHPPALPLNPHPTSPATPLSAAFEPSVGSPFATPTGPPPGPPPGPPTGLSFGSSTGSPFATPTGPPPSLPPGAPGPPLGSPAGPSSGQAATAPNGNSFRLGGRRPVYAPVPGLGMSSGSYPTTVTPTAHAAHPTHLPFSLQPAVAMAPTVPATSPTTLSPESFNSGDFYEQQVAMSNDSIPPPMYRAVYQHWFFKREVESKVMWQPFSMSDSLALESHFLSPELTSDTEVPTEGGRYDVNILRRQRVAVYWEEAPTEVRRCSWFYKGHADSRYVPYDENVATRLEEEYKSSYTQNNWQRRVEFPNGEAVVFHSANVLVHYLSSTSPDAWGNAPGTQHRPRVVKRGVDEFDIESGESETVDHLLFLVHGVGSACDLKFRSVVEVVDDFRSISHQLIESHFSTSVESGKARRVEVLPVSWHEKLHSEDIERQLKSITLHSIPRLRHLTNDTLLDVLFYTSPIYCQTIIDTVAKELNRLYALFLKRNPSFTGAVSLGGHSLGSLILFDLLSHQKGGLSPTTPINSPSSPPSEDIGPEKNEVTEEDAVTPAAPLKRKLSHKISYVMMGPAGTGQPYISYPQLAFNPENFFALGSPIGVFVTVRGIDKLGEDFQFPTCPSFFNIFHPFDLVAYRIESLIRSDMESIPPVLIPHHKGRKRMHLELKETVARMGADLKQKVLDSVRNTWNSVYQLAMFHRSDNLTEQMSQVLENEINQQAMSDSPNSAESEAELNITIGKLNGGRRIDYVLQEAPLESFNEYIFALGSHVCYWKSEDTMLLMLKEMYRSCGVNVDCQVPQQIISPSLGIPSPSTTPETLNVYSQPALLEPSPLFPSHSHSGLQQTLGMDPTAPPSDNRVVGPPPVCGFFRK